MKSVFHGNVITLHLTKYDIIRQISTRYSFFCAILPNVKFHSWANDEEPFAVSIFNTLMNKYTGYQMLAKECEGKMQGKKNMFFFFSHAKSYQRKLYAQHNILQENREQKSVHGTIPLGLGTQAFMTNYNDFQIVCGILIVGLESISQRSFL